MNKSVCDLQGIVYNKDMNKAIVNLLQTAGWKRDLYGSSGKFCRQVADRTWWVDIYPGMLLFYTRRNSNPVWNRKNGTQAVSMGALTWEDLTAIRLLGYTTP